MDVDLRRRQSDSVSVVHGLEHVINQRLYSLIHNLNARRTGSQARIGEFKNFSDGHNRRSGMSVDEKGVNCTSVSLSGTNRQRTLAIIPLSGDTPIFSGLTVRYLP